MSDTEVWPEGTKHQLLWNRSVLAVGAVFCAWLFFDGWWSLGLGAAGAVGVVASALLGDAPHLVITPGSLEQCGHRPQSLRLVDINKVEVTWIPYGNSVLRFVASQGAIECRLNNETMPLIRTVGQLLLPRRHHIHATPSITRELGWP